MKIETNWNLGNFSVALEANADEATAAKLQSLGLLYLGQRVSKVDKVLGGFEKKGDKQVRRVGWKRADCGYAKGLESELAAAFAELELPDETKLVCTAVIGEYVPTKSEPKFQREKLKFAEKESTPEGLDGWLKRFAGYVGATHTEDGESYSPEALQAAKLAIDKFLATA